MADNNEYAWLTEGLPEPVAGAAPPADDYSWLTEGLPEAKGPTPINETQRMIIQNIFDTDQKKRRAYLKKLGWDLAEDGNKIRPLGDKTPWESVSTKIDYSPFEIPTDSKKLSDQIIAYAKETGLDVADIVGDIAIGLVGDVGRVAGGVAGAGAGLPSGPGAAATAIVGAITGGALGEAAGEYAKQALADQVLDLPEDIPNDHMGIAVQAIIAGMIPTALELPGTKKLLRKGPDAIRGWLKNRAEKSTKRVVQNIEKASSFKGKTRDILEAMAKNPDAFTKEAQDEALDAARKQYRSLMGIADDTVEFVPTRTPSKIQPDSVFGKLNRQLEAVKQTTIDALSQTKEASISVGDYLDILKNQAEDIARIPPSQRRPLEEAALRQLNSEIDLVAKEYAPKLTKEVVTKTKDVMDPVTLTLQEVPSASKKEPLTRSELIDAARGKQIDFRGLYKSIDRMQDLVFEADSQMGFKSQNPVVAKVANRLRGLRDEVARKGEQALAKKGVVIAPEQSFQNIMDKQAQVLRSYNTVGTKLKNPDTVLKAFQGVDTIAKADIDDALGSLDKTFNTNLQGEFKDLAFADALKKMREGLEDQGSKSAVAKLAKGVTSGAGTGFLVGAPISASTPLAIGGAVIGGGKAASDILKYGSPERAFQTYMRSKAGEEAAGSTVDALTGQAAKFADYLAQRPIVEQAVKQTAKVPLRQAVPDIQDRTTEDDELQAIFDRIDKARGP